MATVTPAKQPCVRAAQLIPQQQQQQQQQQQKSGRMLMVVLVLLLLLLPRSMAWRRNRSCCGCSSTAMIRMMTTLLPDNNNNNNTERRLSFLVPYSKGRPGATAYIRFPWSGSWSRRKGMLTRYCAGQGFLAEEVKDRGKLTTTTTMTMTTTTTRRFASNKPISEGLPGTTETSSSSKDWLHDMLRQWDLRVAFFSNHDEKKKVRGLKTLRDRAPGEVLLAVPRSHAITQDSVLQQFPQAFWYPPPSPHSSSNNNNKDYKHDSISLTEEQVLIVGLILLVHEESKNNNDNDDTTTASQFPTNHYRPYIQSLPRRHFSVIQSDLPLEIISCLPQAYQRLIHAYRQHVQQLYQSLRQFYHYQQQQQQQENDNEQNSNSSSSSNRTVAHLMLDQQWLTREMFEWAFATIRSRSVGIASDETNFQPAKQQHQQALESTTTTTTVKQPPSTGSTTTRTTTIRVLLPGFDLLNHKFEANVKRDFQNESFVVLSDDAYQAGDQVFISYVENNTNNNNTTSSSSSSNHPQNRDNLNFLLTYGFCPPTGNPEQVLFFDYHDLLQACAQARPQLFTSTVLEQLEALLFKLGKHQDLYSYDASTKGPRPCLFQGIAMMAEIEKQLLSSASLSTGGDLTFPDHVLDSLLRSRKEEICQGLEQAQQIMDHQQHQQTESPNKYEKGWLAFLKSVQTLLILEVKMIGHLDEDG